MGNPEKRDIGGLVEDREGSEIMLEYVNEKLIILQKRLTLTLVKLVKVSLKNTQN